MELCYSSTTAQASHHRRISKQPMKQQTQPDPILHVQLFQLFAGVQCSNTKAPTQNVVLHQLSITAHMAAKTRED
jgi:hypothetical protein